MSKFSPTLEPSGYFGQKPSNYSGIIFSTYTSPLIVSQQDKASLILKRNNTLKILIRLRLLHAPKAYLEGIILLRRPYYETILQCTYSMILDCTRCFEKVWERSTMELREVQGYLSKEKFDSEQD